LNGIIFARLSLHMKQIFLFLFCLPALQSFSQTDTINTATVIVHKDFRLDILSRKVAELNAAATKAAARSAMGYRLQVLSTNDRDLAMRTRTQLLQRYPDQKVYMLFQAPYLKLKFGNFSSKQEADLYKSQISRMLGGSTIYTLTERIEIKPEKEIKEEK
jgi:hypothetical protein